MSLASLRCGGRSPKGVSKMSKHGFKVEVYENNNLDVPFVVEVIWTLPELKSYLYGVLNTEGFQAVAIDRSDYSSIYVDKNGYQASIDFPDDIKFLKRFKKSQYATL